MVAAKPKAKTKAKAKAKAKQQTLNPQRDRKVLRNLGRRAAVKGLNKLIHDLSLSELVLKPKDVSQPRLGRVLRVLERRCADRGATPSVRYVASQT